MPIDVASVLAFAQVARIAFDVMDDYRKGELTEEGLEAAWSAIHVEASGARQRWEASKETPAASARRAVPKNEG